MRIAPLCLLAFAFALTATALGREGNFSFKNEYNKYVWADISWSYSGQPWHIDRAFCLPPGARETDNINYRTPLLDPEVRFRAEIKRGDCRSETVQTLSNWWLVSNCDWVVDAFVNNRTNYLQISKYNAACRV